MTSVVSGGDDGLVIDDKFFLLGERVDVRGGEGREVVFIRELTQK